MDSAAAREVGERRDESLQYGAGASEAAETLEGFIKNIAGVEVGGDKDVGGAHDRAAGYLFGSDGRIDGGVKLHLAVDEPVRVGVPDSLDDGVGFVEVGIFAAGAVGGVGKHSDSRLLIIVGFVSLGGVFDDAVELVLGRLLIDAAVSDDEMLPWSFADEAAGEIL